MSELPTSNNAQVLETDFGSVEDAQTGIPVFLAQTEEQVLATCLPPLIKTIHGVICNIYCDNEVVLRRDLHERLLATGKVEHQRLELLPHIKHRLEWFLPFPAEWQRSVGFLFQRPAQAILKLQETKTSFITPHVYS